MRGHEQGSPSPSLPPSERKEKEEREESAVPLHHAPSPFPLSPPDGREGALHRRGGSRSLVLYFVSLLSTKPFTAASGWFVKVTALSHSRSLNYSLGCHHFNSSQLLNQYSHDLSLFIIFSPVVRAVVIHVNNPFYMPSDMRACILTNIHTRISFFLSFSLAA